MVTPDPIFPRVTWPSHLHLRKIAHGRCEMLNPILSNKDRRQLDAGPSVDFHAPYCARLNIYPISTEQAQLNRIRLKSRAHQRRDNIPLWTQGWKPPTGVNETLRLRDKQEDGARGVTAVTISSLKPGRMIEGDGRGLHERECL